MGASNCNSGLDNGSYTITDIFEDGASVAATGDYTYEFFDNGGTSIQGPNNTNSVSGLAPGNYSVIITRSSSQCASASLPFTISDESTAPNAALSKTDNSDCSGATANGSITASVTLGGGENASDYLFQWYYSASADIGDTGASTLINNGDSYNGFTVAIADNAGFTGNVLDDLPENVAGETFWVRITDNVDPSSSCFTDLDETIVDDPDEIIVTNATVTDSDQCSPSNGAIEVTAITINGAATNSAAGFEALETAGYTFDVLQSDATTLEKTFNIAADGGTRNFPYC